MDPCIEAMVMLAVLRPLRVASPGGRLTARDSPWEHSFPAARKAGGWEVGPEGGRF